MDRQLLLTFKICSVLSLLLRKVVYLCTVIRTCARDCEIKLKVKGGRGNLVSIGTILNVLCDIGHACMEPLSKGVWL